MSVLEDIATWLHVDSVLLGYVIALVLIVTVCIFVSVLTDGNVMALLFSAFAVWVIIALPGLELIPTWTLSIAFLLLLLAFVFPLSSRGNAIDGNGRR